MKKSFLTFGLVALPLVLQSKLCDRLYRAHSRENKQKALADLEYSLRF